MRFKSCFYVLALVLLVTVNAGANMIVNGDFSAGPDTGAYQRYLGGSTGIPGWVVLTDIELLGAYWQSAPGTTRSVDLAGWTPGGIAQTVPTIAGNIYVLSFYLAGNIEGAPAIKSMTVMAESGGTVFDAQNYTFDTTGYSYLNMGWQLETWQFTAVGPTTTISFVDSRVGASLAALSEEGNPACGPVIGNISLNEMDPAPEPLSFALVGSGLIGLAFVFRRRRSR